MLIIVVSITIFFHAFECVVKQKRNKTKQQQQQKKKNNESREVKVCIGFKKTFTFQKHRKFT